MKRTILILLASVLLSGCATNVIKPDLKHQVSKVVIVPAAEEFRGFSSSTVGGMFGLLGAAIEHAATRGTADSVDALYRLYARDSILRERIGEQVKRQVQSMYPNASIEVVATAPKNNKRFSEWLSSERGVSERQAEIGMVIVETGYANDIHRDLRGVAAMGAFGIKYIDSVTNSVIGKTSSLSIFGKYDKQLFAADEKFSESKFAEIISLRFQELHEDLIEAAFKEFNR
jgi:hypothetical protein